MKPCPFCGSLEVDATCTSEAFTPYCYASCDKCEAHGPAVEWARFPEGEDIGEALALAKWNERVA